MFTQVIGRKYRWSRYVALPLMLLLGMVLQGPRNVAHAQQLSGSLSGTARDPSGAPIVGAGVELQNESSGATRRTTTNKDGVFALTSVFPGSYSVTVTASGFSSWHASNVVLTQGDSRSLDNINLKVGDVKATIEVNASTENVAPVDTGAVSTTLNSTQIENYTISGRDAGEFVKILPGMGQNFGLSGNGSFNGADHVTGSNAGPAGSYSSNGTLPNGGMAYLLDGASLLDSNEGTQIANINPEMVSEVKILQSSYGAEFAKGPTVFQAISKSGGSKFHGEAYLFARNSTLNAVDSFQKNQGNTAPDSHYWYPGGNIGGPIILPFTKFNHNRDKLFFWVGYEYMNQHPAGSIAEYFVPTPQMAAGNFSPQYLSTLNGGPSGWGSSFTTPCAQTGTSSSGAAQYASTACPALIAGGLQNGIIPASEIDPNGAAYYKLFPKPNIDPATHNGYNYQFINSNPQNRWEEAQRIDYNIGDRDKLSASFNYQKEKDYHPIATWWAPSQALPYPTPITADTPSKVFNVNYTKVFSATLVNEATFAYADYLNTTVPDSASAIDPSKLGFTYKQLFGLNTHQFADTLSWSGALAEFYPGTAFGGSAFPGGGFGAHKYDPSFFDNLSKVWGTHTMKFGFSWIQTGNKQSTQNAEGAFEFETYGSTSTGNVLADLLTGHASNYSQVNKQLTPDVKGVEHGLYAQDSWKATSRLTVNYGLRLDHEGQFYNPSGNGAIVWDPALYSNAGNAPINTGLVWHAIDKKIPLSGWSSPLYYVDPRLSAAYDLFGNGRTVIRGGAAKYRFQVGTGTDAGADANSSGQFTYSANQGLTSLAQINSLTLPSSGGGLNGSTISPLMMGDNKTPNTWTYNFTISQATPWQSLLEVSYVGSRTRDMEVGTSNNKINDVNIIAPGTYFKPDPVTGAINCVQGGVCNLPNANDYFPYSNYQDIYLESHGSYSNYNALQTTWSKHTGPAIITANYTFGKVLGTLDGVSGNGSGSGSAVDGTSLKNNYSVLAYDHTHILNVSYYIKLPKPIHSNHILKGAINGWELSGYTGIQSGAPIQPNTGGSLNVQWGPNVSNSSYLGTNAITLEPNLVCDPRSNLKSGQYFNPTCFQAPAPGTQGTQIWPFIHGPAYFNSDLSIFKSFALGETRKLQLRFQAFNFLNHPNKAFGVQNNSDLQLQFFRNVGGTNIATTTNQNTATTGYPLYTVGYRQIEIAAKFYF
jgi:hypothetical protein